MTMLFLLDIHRNILSAQALLKCSNLCFNNLVIVLKQNSIRIEFNKGVSLCHFNIIIRDNFLCPSTISSLRCRNSLNYTIVHENNETKLNFDIFQSDLSLTEKNPNTLEIIFRFQISNKDVIENCILKNCISSIDFKDITYNKYKTVKTYKIICTDCGSLLTEQNIKFQSVHKYYEGKSELDETSFCHKHEDHDIVKLNTDSLYIGDMYFYFHHSAVINFRLFEYNKMYKCIKCSSILSFQKKMDNLQYVGFFSDKIMLIQSQPEVNAIEKYKRDTCLLSFCSIIQELLTATVCLKLYLQCKVDDKIDVLLLWINSEKIVQFLLQDENEVPHNIELQGKEVFKVLYCACRPDSELSKRWKHDFSVEFFQISNNMMIIIKELLEETSQYFSDDEESVTGFSFGYLPTYVTVS